MTITNHVAKINLFLCDSHKLQHFNSSRWYSL